MTTTTDRHRYLQKLLGPQAHAAEVAPMTPVQARLTALILDAFDTDGRVTDPDAYAILADRDRLDVYLEQVAR